MPGLMPVDFTAMSVSLLIVMPGATSMKSEAWWAVGKKPLATVPRNAACWGCSESRKTKLRRSIMMASVLPRRHRFASAERFDGLLRRDLCDVDVALLAAEVDAPEGAGHPDVDHVDLGGLLGLVRRERRIPRGLHLQDVERLARHEHHALTVSVDQLHLQIVHVLDHLRGQRAGLDPVGLLEPERGEDGDPCLPHVRLRLAVHLEPSIQTL